MGIAGDYNVINAEFNLVAITTGNYLVFVAASSNLDIVSDAVWYGAGYILWLYYHSKQPSYSISTNKYPCFFI